MRRILGRSRRRAAAGAALSVALILTATTAAAAVEPDHTATLDRAAPRFTWEGSGSGVMDPTYGGEDLGLDPRFRCSGMTFECDYILVRVETAGELALTLAGESDLGGEACQDLELYCPSKDIDAYLYRSNRAGEPAGNSLTARRCASSGSNEMCRLSVWAGFYVVEVEYYQALEAHYIGEVELEPHCARPAHRRAPKGRPRGCRR
jgi:hypothetical protein